MKTNIIETTKARLMVLDMPENAFNVSLIGNENQQKSIINKNSSHAVYFCLLLPQGNWEVLGFYTSLSEEQKEMFLDFKEVDCDIPDVGYLPVKFYRNYEESEEHYSINCDQFNDVSKALDSLLKANDVLLVNPIKKSSVKEERAKQERILGNSDYGLASQTVRDISKKWQEAESKVFSNPLFLIDKTI